MKRKTVLSIFVMLAVILLSPRGQMFADDFDACFTDEGVGGSPPPAPEGELAGDILEETRGGISALQILGLILMAYDNGYAVMYGEPVRRQWHFQDNQGERRTVEAKEWKLTYANGEAKFVLVLTDGSEKEYPIEGLYHEDDIEYLCRYILAKLGGNSESQNDETPLSKDIKTLKDRLDKIAGKEDKEEAETELKAFFHYLNDELCSVSLGLMTVEEGTEPGQEKTLTIRGERYTFRWCPAGEFTRAEPIETTEYVTSRDRYGRTVRKQVKKSVPGETQRVVLTRGFWLLDSEVTLQKYYRITLSRFNDSSSNPPHPITNVAWNDANNFCERLCKITHHKFCLPTEAQWEYACRAGAENEDNADNLSSSAWYQGNSRNEMHDIKTKQPNAWGLYDMQGNVWEWCSDFYEKDYYSASGTVEDPEGPANGTERILRGGSYGSKADNCQPGYRFRQSPDYEGKDIGFRVILIPDDESVLEDLRGFVEDSDAVTEAK